MKTKVIFRKWRNDGQIIALFPEIPATNDGYTCESYMHIGQHSAASPDLSPYTDLATPEEYNDLKKELESIGYILDIRQKVNHRAAMNKRMTALNEMRSK